MHTLCLISLVLEACNFTIRDTLIHHFFSISHVNSSLWFLLSQAYLADRAYFLFYLVTYNNVKMSSSTIHTCTVIFSVSSSYLNLKIMDYEFKSDNLEILSISFAKLLCRAPCIDKQNIVEKTIVLHDLILYKYLLA